MGTKHADQEQPTPEECRILAVQGMNLIRAWVGTRLGVAHERLHEGFEGRHLTPSYVTLHDRT